ncbi:hypothetical protein CTI12_AA583840 [Artemisia annua]|uniref:Uncharacterized protein n=1 Tax=Artemisia annua TaxID=35608 RepID=A0A2U1KND7_ARTAN|nr:hypothetical protein CTI12_AA583840 [Artemisia annua]
MEGGIHPSDTSAFRDCFSLAWRNPYVLRLAFSAGIGGLLFGYDTGEDISLPLYEFSVLISVLQVSTLQKYSFWII